MSYFLWKMLCNRTKNEHTWRHSKERGQIKGTENKRHRRGKVTMEIQVNTLEACLKGGGGGELGVALLINVILLFTKRKRMRWFEYFSYTVCVSWGLVCHFFAGFFVVVGNKEEARTVRKNECMY